MEEEVTEETLTAGERLPSSHHHDDVAIADEALHDHLVSQHDTVFPDRLSFGVLQGIHDRFHGEAHAIDD